MTEAQAWRDDSWIEGICVGGKEGITKLGEGATTHDPTLYKRFPASIVWTATQEESKDQDCVKHSCKIDPKSFEDFQDPLDCPVILWDGLELDRSSFVNSIK